MLLKRIDPYGAIVDIYVNSPRCAPLPFNLEKGKREQICALMEFSFNQLDDNKRTANVVDIETHGLWGKQPDELMHEPMGVIEGLADALLSCDVADFYSREIIANTMYSLMRASGTPKIRRQTTAKYMPELLEVSCGLDSVESVLGLIDSTLILAYHDPIPGIDVNRKAAAETMLALTCMREGKSGKIKADAVALEGMFIPANRVRLVQHWESICQHGVLDFNLIDQWESLPPLASGAL